MAKTFDDDEDLVDKLHRYLYNAFLTSMPEPEYQGTKTIIDRPQRVMLPAVAGHSIEALNAE